jgi:PBSX family phage terminase large subunit
VSAVTPPGYKPYDAGPFTETTTPAAETQPSEKVLEHLPYQEQFLDYGPTYHAIITGIGAGKTTGLIQRLVLNTHLWNVGRTGVVVVPTVPSLRNVLIPELRKWGYLQIGDWQPSKNRWVLPNGSTVIFESADNERKIQRLRGPNIAWFGMDEPSTIAKVAWDVMVGRLREGDYLNAFVSGTPKGFNWVYDTFVDDETALDDVNLVTGVSSRDNPHLPDLYTEEILGQYEGQFYEQEVLGEFTGFEGLVYDWFSADEHVLDTDAVPEPGEYDEVIYGLDWGHNNPATILTLVRQGDRWIAVDEWYERRCTVNDHSRALEDIQGHWGAGVAYCDPSEPANIETLQRDGLDARKAKNDVTPGIQAVAAHHDEFRVAPSCQNLRNEFSQYRYKDDGESDDPVKQNDHALDGIRYALFTHENPDTKTISSSWGTR